MTSTDIHMIEFFSGIGGMKCAVEAALCKQEQDSSLKLKSCLAIDISIHANETYQRNFPHANVRTKLIEQLQPRDLETPQDEATALWTMSPPCQPFTRTRHARQRDFRDNRNAGLRAIQRLLMEIPNKPKWILLENVKHFRTSQAWLELQHVLLQCGYSYKAYLLDPMQLGIPNHRTRFYVLCERSDRFFAREWDGTIHTELPPFTKTRQRQLLTISHFVRSVSQNELQQFILSDETLSKPWAQHLSIVTPQNDETYCFTAAYGRQLHKATGSVLLFQSKNNNSNDEPENDGDDNNNNNNHMLRQYSGRVRRFTPDELLRLFGFPKDFTFPPELSLQHQYKLVGNSISVFCVQELFRELLCFQQKEMHEMAS